MLAVGTYKTKDGRDVKIVAIEDGIAIGYIVKIGASDATTWRADSGRFYLDDDEDHRNDIIDTRPRIKFERWATVYRRDGVGLVIGGLHDTLAAAKAVKADDCLAIAPVPIDCVEGENLD